MLDAASRLAQLPVHRSWVCGEQRRQVGVCHAVAAHLVPVLRHPPAPPHPRRRHTDALAWCESDGWGFGCGATESALLTARLTAMKKLRIVILIRVWHGATEKGP